MQLFVNNFIAYFYALSHFQINSCKSLGERMKLCANLCKLAMVNQRNRLIIKMLKRIEINMELCGTLERTL